MAMMEKPRVLEKVHKYMRALNKNGGKVGKIPFAIGLNYNNVCNFRCEFCFSSETSNEHLKEALPFETIRDLADQADELGIWQFLVVGGELTINKETLLQLIESIGPSRFRMILITNGYLLTKEYAKELKEAGIDCIGVSVSGMDEEEHNMSRGGVPDAHKRALEALDNASEVGMEAWPNVIIGHHNIRSSDLEAILSYADERNYKSYIMLAAPFGVWENNIMDLKDYELLDEIRKKHNCHFDTWDLHDPEKKKISGCWCVNRLYITPLGDVLPCSYMNISIGNIKEQRLADIIEYGFSIKYFGNHCSTCLSANPKFRKKYLPDSMDLFHTVEAKDVFSEEDYI